MGHKSGVHAAGGQGNLSHRRRELQELELRETLEAAQINEAQRLAQKATPACMRELVRIATSHRKDDSGVSENVRIAAIRLLLEQAWGKPGAREPGDGGVRRKGGGGRNVIVNIRQYGVGISKQVKTPVIQADQQAGEEIPDAEFEADL